MAENPAGARAAATLGRELWGLAMAMAGWNLVEKQALLVQVQAQRLFQAPVGEQAVPVQVRDLETQQVLPVRVQALILTEASVEEQVVLIQV